MLNRLALAGAVFARRASWWSAPTVSSSCRHSN